MNVFERCGTLLLVCVTVGVLLCAGAMGQTYTATWTGDATTGGQPDPSWELPDNWNGLVLGNPFPGCDQCADYDVVITDTTPQSTVKLSVAVDISDLTIGSDITVEITSGGVLGVGSGDTLDCDGTVKVFDGAELRIRSGSTHTLDGTIQFMNDPNVFAAGKLSVGGNTTITGSGTIKRGDDKGILAALDVAAKLTLDTNVKAEGELDITVRLTNNGTVHANVDDKIIRLQTNTKDGSGLWKASNGGKLQVDVEVSGAGSWVLGDENGKFEINAACPNLTGTLNATGGCLDINAAFESTGEMECNFNTAYDVDASFVWGEAAGCP